eukprot:7383137-Prymnesium_polylepis.1
MGPLIPIEYSKEEQAAVQPEPGPAPAPAPTLAPAAVKELIAAIPTKKAELFAYEVNWDAAAAGGIVDAKIAPWVGKKIEEYLGEVLHSLHPNVALAPPAQWRTALMWHSPLTWRHDPKHGM